MSLACQPDMPLAELTTFRLGGPCRGFVDCAGPDELMRAVAWLREQDLPFFVIGEGSNILASDEGVPCHVVRFLSPEPEIREVSQGCFRVGAGTRLDDLALFAARQGLDGLSFAHGIPGTVGGAIVGNAGAFGRQISDVLEKVTLLEPDGRRLTLRADQLGFGYRQSNLKNSSAIVLEAWLRLTPGDPSALTARRREILDLRRRRHPDVRLTPCAGSFFQNVRPSSQAGPRQSAGWFLEQAGVHGLRRGGASVFAKHANIIIHTPPGRAQDVYDLACVMRQRVREKFGLSLRREVRLAGSFGRKPTRPNDLLW